MGWHRRAAFDGIADDGAAGNDRGPAALFVGGGPIPDALRGRAGDRLGAGAAGRPRVVAVGACPAGRGGDAPAESLAAHLSERNALDAYTTSTRMAEVARAETTTWGTTRLIGLAGRLRLVSRLIKDEVGARVFLSVSSRGTTPTRARFATTLSCCEGVGRVAQRIPGRSGGRRGWRSAWRCSRSVNLAGP